jgi:hypothetical protein
VTRAPSFACRLTNGAPSVLVMTAEIRTELAAADHCPRAVAGASIGLRWRFEPPRLRGPVPPLVITMVGLMLIGGLVAVLALIVREQAKGSDDAWAWLRPSTTTCSIRLRRRHDNWTRNARLLTRGATPHGGLGLSSRSLPGSMSRVRNPSPAPRSFIVFGTTLSLFRWTASKAAGNVP